MVRIGWSGANAPAWKSIEWPIVPSLTRVISNRSPTRPCSTGPTGPPLYVQRFCQTPGATSSGSSLTVRLTRRTRSPLSGASAGSTTRRGRPLPAVTGAECW